MIPMPTTVRHDPDTSIERVPIETQYGKRMPNVMGISEVPLSAKWITEGVVSAGRTSIKSASYIAEFESTSDVEANIIH